MKNKGVLFYVLFVLSLSVTGQTTKPILKTPPFVSKDFKYDKVVLYECSETKSGLIAGNNKLNEAIIVNRKELSYNQIDTLHKILKKSKTSNNVSTDIHNYLGIVYYLGDDIVAYVSISIRSDTFYFCYRAIKSNPNHWPSTPLTISLFQRQQLSYLCHELGLNCKYPKAKK